MTISVIIKDDWLAACGKMMLSGAELPAKLSAGLSVHMSRMGNCYEVDLLDGREWTVFEYRLAQVIEVPA